MAFEKQILVYVSVSPVLVQKKKYSIPFADMKYNERTENLKKTYKKNRHGRFKIAIPKKIAINENFQFANQTFPV